MAKLFISFLGANPYYPTQYYLREDRSDLTAPVFYVQNAILRAQIKKIDKVLIFTTAEARVNNYHNRISREGKAFKLIEDEGLARALADLQKDGHINDFASIDIPNGYSEAEIWQVFQSVFELMQAGDEIIFDITFGFRSLPMLVMVLLNYARAMRQITVKAIYYGNYEAGRAEKEAAVKEAEKQGVDPNIIDKLKKKMIEAPIIDLKAFAVLQEWTYAAQSFLQVGNANALAALTQSSHPEFSEAIAGFTKALLTCRGQALRRDLDIDHLKRQMTELGAQAKLEAQLKPLLEKVQEKIKGFQSNHLSNGFAAVQWCIDHGMVQQGITFLQESLISYVVEKAIDPKKTTTTFYRNMAGSALNKVRKGHERLIHQKSRYGIDQSDAEIENLYRQVFSFVQSIPGFADLYKRLTGKKGFRNDINHCGFRDDYKSPEELVFELESLAKAVGVLNL